jgi:hypothetical protein
MLPNLLAGRAAVGRVLDQKALSAVPSCDCSGQVADRLIYHAGTVGSSTRTSVRATPQRDQILVMVASESVSFIESVTTRRSREVV